VEDFVARVISRLRQEPGFSRNRHFMAFSSPEGKRALRIHRHLRSIETDLSRGWVATLERTADRVAVTLRSRSSVRTAWLTEDEFRILCTSPLARAAFEPAQELRARAAARITSERSASAGSGPR
jgi:hypothetical protein